MPENMSQPHISASALTSLIAEIRTTLTTSEAAAHLNRRPQTLRIWACRQNGPIRPLNINGRLAWPVSEVRKLLGVAA